MERIPGFEPGPSAWKADMLAVETPYPRELSKLLQAEGIGALAVQPATLVLLRLTMIHYNR